MLTPATIVFRARGDAQIGLGHIMRSLSLAIMLKDNFNCVFILDNSIDSSVLAQIRSLSFNTLILPAFYGESLLEEASFIAENHLTGARTVVLDGYDFDTSYQKIIKESGVRLVCIDDIYAYHFVADVIINQAEGVAESAYSKAPYSKLFLGNNYILLRPPFLASAVSKKKNSTAVKSAFLNMGGADLPNNSSKIIEVLNLIDQIETIHVVIGAVNPHHYLLSAQIEKIIHKKVYLYKNLTAEQLHSLMKNKDIAICPASGIALEAAAVGMAIISGYTANNQLGILAGLIKHNTILNVGDFNAIDSATLKDKISAFIQQMELINLQIKNQAEMIDGRSPERYLHLFKSLQ